jgi:hypothetical protein
MDMEGIAYRFTKGTRGGRHKIQGNLTPDAFPSFSNQVFELFCYSQPFEISDFNSMFFFSAGKRLKKLGQVPKSAFP